MKRAALGFLLLAAATPARSQYAIPHDVIGSGSGTASGGGYVLTGTLGQPAIGTSWAPGTVVEAGYWYVIDQMHIGPTSAVLVVSFAARLDDDGVHLAWRLSEDTPPTAYNVYRAEGDDAEFRRLNAAPVPYTGSTEYVDRDIRPDRTYRYRVGFIDRDGESLSPDVRVRVPRRDPVLEQNYPNPFNPTTSIRFFVPGPMRVRLEIFDTQGRRVRTLVDRAYAYGRHEVTWDGRDDRGRSVASGLYFYRLTTDGTTLTRKLTLLK